VATYIFNILLFIISQLTFSNNFNYVQSRDSENLIVLAEDITLFTVDADEYLDTDDDETSKHYLVVDLNNEITQKSQSIITSQYLEETSDNLKLLNKYIDLPPPSIS
jgi:hypothetical protein